MFDEADVLIFAGCSSSMVQVGKGLICCQFGRRRFVLASVSDSNFGMTFAF